jgi:quercetin 2,3-dioxygenase
VLEGELSHRGDGADGSVVRPRGAQLISSRDGMHHAEGNETDSPVRMLQIWFEPTRHGGPTAYFSRQLPAEPGRHLVAGDDGMPLRCPAKVWWVDVAARRALEVEGQGYLLALAGSPRVGGSTFANGEGAPATSGTYPLEGDGALLLIEFSA